MAPKNPFKQAGDALTGKKPASSTTSTTSKAAAKKAGDAARKAAVARADKAAAAAKKPRAFGDVAINRQAPRRQGGASRKAH